jgi:arylsulfatase A-like enzyme
MWKKSLTATVMLTVGLAKAADKHPNVLFVFADEMRQQTLGFLKQDPVYTPNLDMFAKNALFLPNTVSNRPICSPFRACLLTGMYPHKTGVPVNCHSSKPKIFLKRDATCISDVLSKNNYDCGYIGKWHLEAPFKPYVNGKKSCYAETCPKKYRHGFNFWFESSGGPGGHFVDKFWANDTPRDAPAAMPKGKWGCEFETDMAIKYIKNKDGKMRDGTKPFALFVSWKPPHAPFNVPEKYLKLYKNKKVKDLLIRKNFGIAEVGKKNWRSYPNKVKKYFAMVTGVDDQFGRLLRVLKEKGIAENTIVVFTADHGEMLGSHKRSGKTIYYDEAFVIPFLIRWPGHIKPGTDMLHFNTPDMAPTLLDLLGLKNKIPESMQGYDQANILLGKKGFRPEGSLYWGGSSGKTARGWRDKRYTYILNDNGNEILFDNKLDPYQLTNAAEKNPKICQDLKKKVFADLKRINDPWKKYHEK